MSISESIKKMKSKVDKELEREKEQKESDEKLLKELNEEQKDECYTKETDRLEQHLEFFNLYDMAFETVESLRAHKIKPDDIGLLFRDFQNLAYICRILHDDDWSDYIGEYWTYCYMEELYVREKIRRIKNIKRKIY